MLNVQLKPDLQSNHLIVIGTAHLNGTLNLDLVPGIYLKNQFYDLIFANDISADSSFYQINHNGQAPIVSRLDPNRFSIACAESQIILPIPNDQLLKNQKNVANYLFSDCFPFENTSLITLLQNLFTLPVDDYKRELSRLTPESYGALSITQNQIIHYLATLPQTTCLSDKKKYFHISPFYLTSCYDKDDFLPDYQYNTFGLSIHAERSYSTRVIPKISLTYAYTHTDWKDNRGRAIIHNFYLSPSLYYKNNKFCCSCTILGGYNCHGVHRTLTLGTPIEIYSNLYTWEAAGSLQCNYTWDMKYITLIPEVSLTQTNVFQRSLREDKPENLNLKIASKRFSYLDSLLSLRLQKQVNNSSICIIPSLQFGWHNTFQLNNPNFISQFNSYTAYKDTFLTQTYCAKEKYLFWEARLHFSHKSNCTVSFSYREEYGENTLISAMAMQLGWKF